MERDLIDDEPTADVQDFNSHAHVERDKLLMIDIIQISHFNSHAHVERDLINN